jgi:hypothetical protein
VERNEGGRASERTDGRRSSRPWCARASISPAWVRDGPLRISTSILASFPYLPALPSVAKRSNPSPWLFESVPPRPNHRRQSTTKPRPDPPVGGLRWRGRGRRRDPAGACARRTPKLRPLNACSGLRLYAQS